MNLCNASGSSGDSFIAFWDAGFDQVKQSFFIILAVLPDIKPGQVETENIQVPQHLLYIIAGHGPGTIVHQGLFRSCRSSTSSPELLYDHGVSFRSDSSPGPFLHGQLYASALHIMFEWFILIGSCNLGFPPPPSLRSLSRKAGISSSFEQ